MNPLNINKDRARAKWAPVLESMGVNDESRLDWMSEYAETHSILESRAYANQGNVAGMGNVSSAQPGSQPGATISSGAGTTGSGDYGQNLLPVAMKIAAHTIGLDLVSVKPSPGPKIDLMYIDFAYDDTNEGNDEKMTVFKVKLANSVEQGTLKTYLDSILTAEGVTQTVGGLDTRIYVNLTGAGSTAAGAATSHTAAPSNKEGVLEFLGYSRIDGYPMFRAFHQSNTASSGAWTFQVTANTFDQADTILTVVAAGFSETLNSPAQAATGSFTTSGMDIQLISALEDQLPGFVSNWSSNVAPMRRGEDDAHYPGIIAPRVETKTIAVGTISVSSALKRTEMEDIKANTGIDIVQKMESILVNELSQTISKQIVSKVFEMGELNRASAPERNTANIADGTIFDFDIDTFLSSSGLTGETSHAVQRKLISKILNASNYIATEGRIGAAQYVVTNGNLAAALQDIAGYTINPVKSSIGDSGNLYPVGQIGNVSIYVDPYMKYNDNRIAVGRKNDADKPGIVFVPYLMAQSINIISEATFAPRMLLRSRYAIAELGWYPQKQYMTIHVYDSNQVLV